MDSSTPGLDPETRRQLEKLETDKKLKELEDEIERQRGMAAAYHSEMNLILKGIKEKLEETYSKATQANRKADIANLELSKKADKSELPKPSALEVPSSSKPDESKPKEPTKTWREVVAEYLLKK